METVWSFYGMLILMVLSITVGYGVIIIHIRPNLNKATEATLVRSAMKYLGIDQPTWHTLAVSASRDVDAPAEMLWETWAYLEGWNAWSANHRSARWLGDPCWQVGASFEQTLSLGFPLGQQTFVETVSEINPGRKVRWCKTKNGVSECHIWSFTVLPNRQVRVTSTQVFHGAAIGLLKPIVFWQWQRKYERSLDNLARKTREQVRATKVQ